MARRVNATELAAALARAEARAGAAPGVRRSLRSLVIAAARRRGARVVRSRLFTGQTMQVVVPEIVGNRLYLDGFIEADVTRVLLERVRPGLVVFDVGAHYGYFTLLAAPLVQPGGTVVAFEPGAETVALLRANVAATDGVHVEHRAVAGRAGEVRFRDYGAGHSALNTLLGSARVPSEERRDLKADTYAVPTTTLDEYAAQRGLVPGFVKIDAEGAELEILRGMVGVLRDAAPVLSMEVGDYPGMDAPRSAEAIDYLARAGYDAFEYHAGFVPHRRRDRYGYANLFFVKRG